MRDFGHDNESAEWNRVAAPDAVTVASGGDSILRGDDGVEACARATRDIQMRDGMGGTWRAGARDECISKLRDRGEGALETCALEVELGAELVELRMRQSWCRHDASVEIGAS
jgi:hypothetical protein